MNIASRPTKHSAPGQYLGYALQPVRLCYYLLTSPGAQVSLEHLDDVAVHFADGRVTVEQTKSALAHNPLSNWSSDLWKAIANWINSVCNGDIEVDKARFILYVTPMKTGAAAQALSDATTRADVLAITGKVQVGLAKLKSPPACLPFLQTYLQASEDIRSAIVTRMKIVSVDEDPVQPLRDLLKLTVSPAIIDSVCQSAIGLAKEQADRMIRHGKPAVLDADQFCVNFRAFVQKNNLPGYLASFTSDPPPQEIEAMLSTRPTFVRQLDLIEATSDERVRAVSDFLRTSADKAIWAEAGLIFEQGLDDWNNDLIRRHRAVRGEIEDLYFDRIAAVRGRLAYRRCSLMEPPMEGRAVPGHFVHGCFNELADTRRLGWHPDFDNLLDAGDA